jgi:hypothetical protein
VIATYNVAHSRDTGGTGEKLDLGYLASLGPEAIPAIDRYRARAAIIPGRLLLCRQRLVEKQRAQASDWRGWSLREWRLSTYLRRHPV